MMAANLNREGATEGGHAGSDRTANRVNKININGKGHETLVNSAKTSSRLFGNCQLVLPRNLGGSPPRQSAVFLVVT